MIDWDSISHIGQAALIYHSFGLHPIFVKPNKEPLYEWKQYQKKQPTETEIKNWYNKYSNITDICVAIITGIKISIVDIEKEGLNHFPELNNIKTPKVTSQRQGIHYYFKSENLKTTNIIKDSIHLGDISSKGKYILVPPSKGFYGKYKFIKGYELGNIPLVNFSEYLASAEGMRWCALFLQKKPPSQIPSDKAVCAKIIKVEEKVGYFSLHFVVLDDPWKNYPIVLQLDWPESSRSRNRWRFLFSAIGIIDRKDYDFDYLKNKIVKLELVKKGASLRIGGFFPVI